MTKKAVCSLALGGSLLLLTACANQLPAPAPVPGQPLTYAQQYELKKKKYQELTDARRGSPGCRVKSCM